ncbi:MAG: GtrA family protein [Acidobacteria bacterium]|nr:GtrA family protein [Acidobacteriota bacterium]
MAVRVPTGQQPGSASEAALNGDEVTSGIGISANGSQVAPGGTGLRSGGRWTGSGVRREFARYVVVGGFAFVCDASTLFSLTQFLKVNYLISGVVGFILGVGVNYLLCRKWVFQRRRLKNTPAEMTIFTLIGVFGLSLNETILWTFQARLGIYYLFAKGVSGVVVFMWNFGARKLVLFR